MSGVMAVDTPWCTDVQEFRAEVKEPARVVADQLFEIAYGDSL
jgi:hypothetical protein